MKLTHEVKNGFEVLTNDEKDAVFAFGSEYMSFLSKAKTERESCDEAVKMLEGAGFAPIDGKRVLQPGDRVYAVNRGKGVMAMVVGAAPMSEGVALVGAHIDSPRLDLKPAPVFEDSGIAFLKTRYYGGIKKYQWTAVPLALHGVVVLQDGTAVNITVGEDESDPVFCITDLLPHLAQEQMQKTLKEAIAGEGLNLLAGNIPFDTTDKEIKDKVKYSLLSILNEKYGIVEEDFASAELEVVPAFPARDLGFDRSMIAGYGHDDRVCAYTALRAVMEVKNPAKTAVCLLVDKEEVGSMGNTGMRARFFENVLAKAASMKEAGYTDMVLRECLSNSACLSADVSICFDPNYPDACDKRNTAIINGGVVVTKYTGSGGKSGASDASAEFTARVRRVFNENGVLWQSGELGKVDLGGGGTIAQFLADLDIDVIDCGVGLFSMHSPFEVAGKVDVYMAYKGYLAFYQFGIVTNS